MTETLPDEAGTMPGLGPVPLLQRQSASNSRWTRTVPMASAALFVFGAILAHLVLQQADYAPTFGAIGQRPLLAAAADVGGWPRLAAAWNGAQMGELGVRCGHASGQ